MAAKKKSTFVYTEAADELELILREIETGDADIDELSDKVERAAELIRACRESLAGTELRVRKVVEELAGSDAAAAPEDDEDNEA